MDKRIRYGWLWMLFLIVMVVGAGFMTSTNPRNVTIGIFLLITPLLLTGLALAVFYALTWWRAISDRGPR